LLRKYYNELWISLPENYLVTLQWLSKSEDIIDASNMTHLVDLAISCPNATMSNKIILDLLIFTAKNDFQLLGFSYLLEKIMQDSKLVVIQSFRNG